jgi:hypothetical protein
MSLVVIRRCFGPRCTERELRRMNDRSDPTFVQHAGCWVNDFDCGAPDCPMGRHDDAPELVVREVWTCCPTPASFPGRLDVRATQPKAVQQCRATKEK